MIAHPALPDRHRQLLVAELADAHARDRRGALRPGDPRRDAVPRGAPADLRRPAAAGSPRRWSLSILIVVLSARPVAQPDQPEPGDERVIRPAAPGEHLWRLRERQPRAVRGHRGGLAVGVDPQTAAWKEYEFPGKPGDVRRRPPQVAPYHLRLDWLLWFVPLSPAYAEGWLDPLPAPPARGRPRGARPRAGRPVPRRPAGMGSRPALPLSVHDRGRASGNGRVVGP